MKVKICGIRNIKDALFVAECGADAIGFVLYPPSKRFVEPCVVAEIIQHLPPFVLSVGVFAQDNPRDVMAMAKEARIDVLQLHNVALFGASYPQRILKVQRVATRADVIDLADEFILCDAFSKEFGGSGLRIPLELFQGRDCSKIILAGGLNPDNLSELDGFGFYGVDVSSGVESNGVKDYKKIKSFIENAKKI